MGYVYEVGVARLAVKAQKAGVVGTNLSGWLPTLDNKDIIPYTTHSNFWHFSWYQFIKQIIGW